jgi:Tfp pilus assembly protein PilF
MNANQNSSAARYIEQCVQSRPNFKQAYLLGAQIYQKIGDQARAQYFNNIANQLR